MSGLRIVTLSSSRGYHVQDLSRAAAARGCELAVCSWQALTGRIGTGPSPRESGGGDSPELGPRVQAKDEVLDHAGAVLPRTMPAGSLEQVVFRMDVLQRLESAGVVVVNGPRAIETSVDKYLALARMERAGLPVPPTFVAQRACDAMAGFERLGGDVVLKPVFGSEGRGIRRVRDPSLAAAAFARLEEDGAVIYQQKWVEHDGTDLRLFVIGGEVIAAMRRRHEEGAWPPNVGRGGRGEPARAEALIENLAVRAAASCGAEVAGVDLVVDREGRPWLLEVNAVPGWKELARVTGVDVAAAVIEHVVQRARASVASAPLSPARWSATAVTATVPEVAPHDG